VRRPHATICLCTCRRTERLPGLLRALAGQETGTSLTHSIAVVDNDPAASAVPIIQAFAGRAPVPVRHGWEPEPNIARARNRAIALAEGEHVAFIDDDEQPGADWLLRLHETAQRENVAAVLGPVRPRFLAPPPRWLVLGRFWERAEFKTGTRVPWPGCRTGNALVRRDALLALARPFDERLATGGEDVDLFRRLAADGHSFVWCAEAAVHEEIPPHRCTRGYLIRRALLRGRDSLRVTPAPARAAACSAFALPAYTLMLPVSLLLGHHVFMRLAVRLGDHAGRLLAVPGLEPVRTRLP
jgi:succinoglycan biosynthesis protein ExoM